MSDREAIEHNESLPNASAAVTPEALNREDTEAEPHDNPDNEVLSSPPQHQQLPPSRVWQSAAHLIWYLSIVVTLERRAEERGRLVVQESSTSHEIVEHTTVQQDHERNHNENPPVREGVTGGGRGEEKRGAQYSESQVRKMALRDPTVWEWLSPGRGEVVKSVEVQATHPLCAHPVTIYVDLVRSSDNPSKIIPLCQGDIYVPLRCLNGVQFDEGSADASEFSFGGSVEMGNLWPDGVWYYCLDLDSLTPRQREQLELQIAETCRTSDQAIILEEMEKVRLTDSQKSTIREGIRLITEYQQSVRILEQPTDIPEAPHCVIFVNEERSWSLIGMCGLIQRIAVMKSSPAGSVAHEILHSLGFYHTQSRYDRDSYIRIDFSNIQPKKELNFTMHADALDVKQYDYSSIMHYGAYAFALNKKEKTIYVLDGVKQEIGQRDALSAGDLASLATLYPGTVKCTFGATAKEFKQQAWFKCMTCWGEGRYGCCMACSLDCHRGHTIVSMPPMASYCDCGACSHRYKCTRFTSDQRKVVQPAASSVDGTLVCVHCYSCTCSGGDEEQNPSFQAEVVKHMDVIDSTPTASGGCVLC
ncbi:zinc metalloprotease [Pelomyxa schiedti]|nr:zinc metalloprotease [Pelomyxa schiedti]